VGTEIRQAYAMALEKTGGSVPAAQEALYIKVREIIKDMLGVSNSRTVLSL